ncbi:MAG: hypothetical protein GX117_14555 [Candidatus Hydrogenedentes bacterium]|jgi:superfamily I DNA/RNA helicase|nr:hypothetical protein [Candidatus Hydrogenedentota bacterium]
MVIRNDQYGALLMLWNKGLQDLISNIDTTAPSPEEDAKIEEQRRLFYVAITRARQTLILSSVTRLPLKTARKMLIKKGKYSGGMLETITSTFIHELGPQCPAAVTGQRFLNTARVQS